MASMPTPFVFDFRQNEIIDSSLLTPHIGHSTLKVPSYTIFDMAAWRTIVLDIAGFAQRSVNCADCGRIEVPSHPCGFRYLETL
jgi:hypothetical protein